MSVQYNKEDEMKIIILNICMVYFHDAIQNLCSISTLNIHIIGFFILIFMYI